MPDPITIFSNRLNELDPFDRVNFPSDLEELLSQSSAETLRTAHDAIFQFLERYPESQLLGPFLDIFDNHCRDYFQELARSVDRQPSTSTLLLVNRHLNGDLDKPLRDCLMTCLLNASQQDAASPMLREEAARYLERQNHLQWSDLVSPSNDRTSPDSELLTPAIRELEGSYVILRGYTAPDSAMPIEDRRFGLVADSEYEKLSSMGWVSLPMHRFVAIDLPKYLRAGIRTTAIVVEGHLSIDIRRVADGTVQTIYRVMAKRIIVPGD